MASTRKSVWEVRFQALMQHIRMEREHTQFRAGVIALSVNGLSDETKTELRVKLDQLNKIIRRGDELEKTNSRYIFIIE